MAGRAKSSEAVDRHCPLLHRGKGTCDWCGCKLKGRQKRWCSRQHHREFVANHRWTQAKAAAKAAVAWWKCEHCGEFTQAPEVNHIEPVRGRHNEFGCHHHQGNLEVLCRPCHLAVTKQQREEGKFQ